MKELSGFYGMGYMNELSKYSEFKRIQANYLYPMQPTVPHPDVFWCRLNGMGTPKNTPKKILATLFPYIFHGKIKLSIFYEYFKTKIFSRDTNILPQTH